ncbi:hypothetical protein TWF506_001656 [Arthrobotrys conoides]|uniref:Uncharacterized protein n=1 Tax=Arthrobotrys conoides TaxID=74498 RepID=A0AAN8PS52_9PEZI
MAKPSSSKTSPPPPPNSPYRPRVKKSMIWHPGHCTRSFIVTDFYTDLNALIIEHGEIVKCCGQFWRANRQCSVGQGGTNDCEEPHPIYKRYRPSTINDTEVSTIARPLNRCQCRQSSNIGPNPTSTNPIPSSSSTSTSHRKPIPPNPHPNTNSPSQSPKPQSSRVPFYSPITSATYSPTEYTFPEVPYSGPRPAPTPSQPSSSSTSAYRDPVIGLSSRLPLERTKAHVSEGIGSALGKFKKGKEKEGSKSPTFWGCIGEDGGKSVGEEGKSPVGREKGCQHDFYCSHCGKKNSVWSDRRGSEVRE